MKTSRLTPALLLPLALTACQQQEDAVAPSLILHYDRPAQYFEEALPIGNGQLGGMVYGGTDRERISLNDITLWTGGPDLKPWTPDAYRYVPKVRELLDQENYPAAELENMKIEGHNSEIYQPLGNLLIEDQPGSGFEGQEVTSYQRTLDIDRALATTSITYQNGARLERECFASAPDSVVVVRLKSYGTALRQRILLTSPLPTVQVTAGPRTQEGGGEVALAMEGYTAYSTHPEQGREDEWFHYDPERGTHFRTELRVLAPEGCVTADSDSSLLIQGCDEAVLVLTDVTSFNGPYCDPATEGRDYRSAVAQRLDKACALTYAQLQARQQEDYQRLFRRVRLDLGATPDSIARLNTDEQLLMNDDSLYFNPDLEELYFQYGRYLLISSSRTEGVPANLQGLWNEKLTPPWSCNYTVNINVEENYWPAETGALPEMHRSMLSWIERLPRSGAITAQNYYLGAQCIENREPTVWCACHNSDIWCATNPVGYQKEDTEWCCWPLGGVWTSTHLWEHYVFTGDRAFLQEAYPVMKGAALFALQWLVEKDGHLMTSPSTSPENDYKLPDGYCGSTLYGGSADVAMIRELLTDVRHAASLGCDEDTAFIAQVDQTLAQLLPYRIGAKGQLQEWYHDWEDEDPHHRHQSHLFGLYPGHQITVDQTPELAQACARTLEIKGDKTTGWSAGWRVNLLAHLRDGEGAYHMLRRLMTFVHPQDYRGEDRRRGGGTYPNLFDAHSPFQIDGNFGGAAGMMEMLVQSRWINDQEAEAIVLPALPQQWQRQGQVSGIRLRGGWELSMKWADGKVVDLKVTNLTAGTGRKLHVKAMDGQNWEF